MGPGQGFIPASLKSINAPILVDTAKFDEVLEPKSSSTAVAQAIPSAKELVRPVGHFAYVPICVRQFPPSAELISQICTDSEGIDRAEVHKQISRDVIEFFGSRLRGK